MKYYNMYMERQGISRESHENLLALGRDAAERPSTVRNIRRWQSAAALAACCALVLGAGVWKLTPVRSSGQFASAADSLIPGVKDTYGPGEIPPDESGSVAGGDNEEKRMFPMIPYINYQNLTTSMDSAASIAFPEGSFHQDLTSEQIRKIFWGPEGRPEAEHPEMGGEFPWMLFWDKYTVNGYAIYDGEGNLFVMHIFGEYSDQNASFELSLSPDRLPPTCLANPDLDATDVSGVPVTGWSCSYDRNGDGVTDNVCGSEFMTGDIGIRFESVGAPFRADSGDGWDSMAAAQQFNALFVRQALSGDGGLYLDHVIRAEAIPEWREEEFSSLSQARQESEFAPYLPRTDLSGYVEFYGRLSYQEDRENMLFVRWSWWYDDVEVCVYRNENIQYNLADISNPASYDRRLYEIPLADTVPEEYRDTVWMPTFRAEDMTLEIVKARGAEKDTGGMSYRFQVLHTDGTLVEYRCDGLTAEQVWKLVEDTLQTGPETAGAAASSERCSLPER